MFVFSFTMPTHESSVEGAGQRKDGSTTVKEVEEEGGEGVEGSKGFEDHTILMQQAQTDLFLCLRSSFLLCFRLEELEG